MTIPLSTVLPGVIVSGATRRKLLRAKDATVRTLKSGYIYVDADDPTFDASTKSGTNLMGGVSSTPQRWLWTGSDITVASDAAFGGHPVFDAVGNQHYFSIPTPPTLRSYTIIAVASVPQTVIDAAEAFTLGNRYLLSFYDPVANTFIGGLQFLGSGGSKGWSVNPKSGVNGNGFNILYSTYPAVKPVADTPFILAWSFDADDLTSRFYFGDGASPIASKSNHAQADAGGGDKRYYPMSFSIGSNTASWEGKMACLLISDDSSEATRMTDAQRTAIMSEWSAHYGI